MKIKLGHVKIILKIIRETKSKFEDKIIGEFVVADNSGALSKINHQTTLQKTKDFPLESVRNADEPIPCSSSDNHEMTIISDNTFSSHDTVISTLLNHPQGEAVVTAARSTFSEEKRRQMIRILVSELIKVYNSHYPPENAKVALAKAIVSELPLLKDLKAKKGYEHYYCNVTKRGFIEFRLLTLRKTLSPSKKKYITKSRQTSVDKNSSSVLLNLLSKEDLDSKIAWMKFKSPSSQNRPDIEKYLMETMPNRREWIVNSAPTISQIFKEYPRLLDFNGEMIDREFEGLFRDKGDNFILKFPSYYCSRILKYSKINRYDVYKRSQHITDECLRALIVLTNLLPMNNASLIKNTNSREKNKKGKKRPRTEDEGDVPQDSSSAFIKFLPEGTNLPHDAKKTTSEATTNVQPFIMCSEGQNGIKTFFVQGDGWFLKPLNDNPVNAFDLLFKTYFALNLCYPFGLQNFFNFMESYVYDLNAETRGVVTSLHINLCNLKMTEDEDAVIS